MKTKKIISAVLALAMIMSTLCIGASAVSAAPIILPANYQLDPNYLPERFGGTISAEEVYNLRLARPANGEDGTGVMPYNSGSGTTGSVIFTFTVPSDSNTIYWNIDWEHAGIDDTYYYQFWRLNGDGIPPSKVDLELQCSFGAGQYFNQLISGAVYYIQCSSEDVPTRGASISYSYTF